MVIISINPATLEKTGEVNEFSIEDIKNCFAHARKIQMQWQNLSLGERAQIIVKINEYLLNNADEISNLISKEMGKPPGEAFVSEVFTSIDSTFYYYNNVERLVAQENIELGLYSALNKRSYLFHKPVGVVAVIGPYNYPFVIPFEQIVQALIAGNAVVFKPSSETVLVGQKIQEAFDSLEKLPKGLVQTVFGSGSKIGNLLVDEANRVVFTGSTETGKLIMKRAADTLTPVALELGGKSAMIVLPDANIERTVRAARWGCFTNSGQVCSSVKRLFLHDSIEAQFTAKLVELTLQLKQGNPSDESVDVGAMVNEYQMNKVLHMIEIAKSEGAKVLCGGRRNPHLKGYFIEPTILGNCRNDMRCVQEEIFGPVLPIITFHTPEEAITMANTNPFGLTASVWSNNIEQAEILARKINAGTVMVNNCVYTFGLAATPWGGVKSSGIGRTHGKFGFLEVMDPIHINIDTSKAPDLWWMPYDNDFSTYMENFKILTQKMIIKK